MKENLDDFVKTAGLLKKDLKISKKQDTSVIKWDETHHATFYPDGTWGIQFNGVENIAKYPVGKEFYIGYLKALKVSE
jgi:hypothetical protein